VAGQPPAVVSLWPTEHLTHHESASSGEEEAQGEDMAEDEGGKVSAATIAPAPTRASGAVPTCSVMAPLRSRHRLQPQPSQLPY
jgi:hypothetical protein